MEFVILLVAVLVAIIMFFRWFIIIIATVIGMMSGGFFAGLGVGVFTYFLLKLTKWITLAYVTAKIATFKSDQPPTKE